MPKGRPRKADEAKFVPAMVYLTPARLARLKAYANARGVGLSVILREYLDPEFRITKKPSASVSC